LARALSVIVRIRRARIGDGNTGHHRGKNSYGCKQLETVTLAEKSAAVDRR
jgi:hypothetical protein